LEHKAGLVDAPRISVIIPAFNRAALIGGAINSVLQQTLEDWELIVVDDASVDDLPGALEKFTDDRIRLERHSSNRGVSAARNTGLAAARGRYVAFLDSDDHWLPTKLEKQVRVLENDPDDFLFCMTQTRVDMGGEWHRIRPSNKPELGQSFAGFLYAPGGFAQVSSFMLAREAALQIGFEESLRQYEDHLFFLAAGARKMTLAIVEEPLTIWHNDVRADRLSGSENEKRAQQFLKFAAPLMSDQEQLAFRLRTLFGFDWAQSKKAALRSLGRGVATSAISSRFAAEILIRTAAPAFLYNWLRRQN
jgi:glycosyltransferase involved in cell wall biosynthesis